MNSSTKQFGSGIYNIDNIGHNITRDGSHGLHWVER